MVRPISRFVIQSATNGDLKIKEAGMKRLQLPFIAGLVLVVTTSAFAFSTHYVARDSVPSPRVFNPPRVITPADTIHPPEPPSPPPTARPPKIEEPKKTRLQKTIHRCTQCQKKQRVRVGGGGGPTGGYLLANLDEVNSKIKQMGIPALPSDIFVMGGHGFLRAGSFIIGGGGYGGTSESSGIPDSCLRYAKMEIGYGGVIVGISRIASRYEVTLGTLLGGGSVDLTRRRNSRNVQGWSDAWDIFDKDSPETVATDALNVTSVMKAKFVAIEPFVDLKIWVLPFMAIDFSASYLHANIPRGQWKLDGVKIPDSPQMNIGGPSLRLGLHFGV